MKTFKIILVALFVFGMAVPSVWAANKDGKIAYVDLSRLFDEYHKTKEYDKLLEAKHKQYEAESNTRVEKIREQQAKLDLLKEDKKANLQKQIETMKSDLMAYDQQQKTDLTKERNEKIREILLEIEKIVSGYAEKNGYSLILNDRVLIYGDPAEDVTESILGEMNAAAAKSK